LWRGFKWLLSFRQEQEQSECSAKLHLGCSDSDDGDDSGDDNDVVVLMIVVTIVMM
jgi:hypothetical protein